MIEVRYTLLDIVNCAIDNNLTREELESAIMSECSFKRTTKIEYNVSALLIYLNYNID